MTAQGNALGQAAPQIQALNGRHNQSYTSHSNELVTAVKEVLAALGMKAKTGPVGLHLIAPGSMPGLCWLVKHKANDSNN